MPFSRTIEFFKVECSSDFQSEFGRVYRERLADNANKGVLRLKDPDEALFLWKFDTGTSQGVQYCEGMIVRLRMSDVPKEGDYTHNLVTDFQLQPNHGFAELAYFVYLPAKKILALMAGKQGVKSGKFRQYALEVVGLADFELSVLLAKDAFERLKSWHNITRLEWKVRVGNGFPANPPLVQNRSVSQMLDHEGERFITLKEEYSNPRRSGSLPERVAKDFIDKLLRSREQSPKAILQGITVKGAEDVNSQEATIELLKDKFSLDVTLEAARALDYAECQRRVRSLVIENRSTLEQLVGDI